MKPVYYVIGWVVFWWCVLALVGGAPWPFK
jgi:hypothetical protein